MKNSRLFEILYLLVEGRAVTAGELARQDEILFALQAILATGGESEGETLARLTALFRREGTDWLEVDFTDWGSGAAERENFALVKKDILARWPLSFTYYSSAGERSHQTAESVRLVFKGGCWCLSAFCRRRQDWCIFRLVRMENLALEEGSCPFPAASRAARSPSS